jgi:uncharacterized membrane protein YqjE
MQKKFKDVPKQDKEEPKPPTSRSQVFFRGILFGIAGFLIFILSDFVITLVFGTSEYPRVITNIVLVVVGLYLLARVLSVWTVQFSRQMLAIVGVGVGLSLSTMVGIIATKGRLAF